MHLSHFGMSVNISVLCKSGCCVQTQPFLLFITVESSTLQVFLWQPRQVTHLLLLPLTEKCVISTEVKDKSILVVEHMCVCVCVCVYIYIYIYIYRVSQEECARLRESVPYVKLYRYNPKHLSPKLNGCGDNGQRKVWASLVSTYYTPSVMSYLSNAPARSKRYGHAVTLACALQHSSSDVTR